MDIKKTLLDDFEIRETEGLELEEEWFRKRKREPFGQIPLWIAATLATTEGRHSASFWALLIVLGAKKHLNLPRSHLRDEEDRIRVSGSLFPRDVKPPTRAKNAALELLETAGVVEVYRYPHASPRIRFRLKPRRTTP